MKATHAAQAGAPSASAPRLSLNRNTLRTLTATELHRVAGGSNGGCGQSPAVRSQ